MPPSLPPLYSSTKYKCESLYWVKHPTVRLDTYAILSSGIPWFLSHRSCRSHRVYLLPDRLGQLLLLLGQGWLYVSIWGPQLFCGFLGSSYLASDAVALIKSVLVSCRMNSDLLMLDKLCSLFNICLLLWTVLVAQEGYLDRYPV